MAMRIIEESVTITRKRNVYTCDGCGKDTTVSLRKCFICGKEFCPDCCRYMPDDHKIWHGDSIWCCNSCWEIGKDWREWLDDNEKEFFVMVKEEVGEWKKKVMGDEDE